MSKNGSLSFRFGIGSTGVSSGKSESTEAMKKRAERFGLSVVSSPSSGNPISSEAATEKLKRRAERFGGTNVTNLAVITTGKVGQDFFPLCQLDQAEGVKSM